MLCRVCGEVGESVWHVASECKGLAQTECKRKHDRMGLRMYRNLCRRYEVKCSGKCHKEVLDEVKKSGICL